MNSMNDQQVRASSGEFEDEQADSEPMPADGFFGARAGDALWSADFCHARATPLTAKAGGPSANDQRKTHDEARVGNRAAALSGGAV